MLTGCSFAVAAGLGHEVPQLLLPSATVTGLDHGKDHTFRLWLRAGQMELYIDDLLMQSFFYAKATGRIGFISQESEVTFSNLKFYSMSL